MHLALFDESVSHTPAITKSVCEIMTPSKRLFQDNNANNQAFSSPLYTPGVSLTDFSQLTVNNHSQAMAKLPILSDIPYPRLTMADLIGQSQNTMSDSLATQPKHTVVMKVLLTGLISGVMGHVSVLRMCPPMTTKNWSYFQPLLALGTSHCVQYVSMYVLYDKVLESVVAEWFKMFRPVECGVKDK